MRWPGHDAPGRVVVPSFAEDAHGHQELSVLLEFDDGTFAVAEALLVGGKEGLLQNLGVVRGQQACDAQCQDGHRQPLQAFHAPPPCITSRGSVAMAH